MTALIGRANRLAQLLVSKIPFLTSRRRIRLALLAAVVLAVAVMAVQWLRPRSPEAMWVRTQAFLEADNATGAKLLLQRLLAEQPGHGPALLAMAQILLAEAQQQDPTATYETAEAAKQHLAAAIAFAKQQKDFAPHVLFECASQKAWRFAAEVAPDVLAVQPENADAIFALAMKSYSSNAQKDALQHLDRLMVLPSEPRPRTLALRLAVFEKLNDPSGIESVTALALQASRADDSTWDESERTILDKMLLISIQRAATQEDTSLNTSIACEWWEKRAAAGPALPTAEFALQAADIIMNRYLSWPAPKAVLFADLWLRLFDLGKAATAHPADYPTCYRTLATLALFQDRPDLMLTVVQLGIASLGNLPESDEAEILNLNRIAAQQLTASQDFIKAETYIRNLRKSPDIEGAGWGDLFATHAAMAEGRWEEASDSLSGAVAKLGLRPIVRTTLASLLLYSRQYKEAIEHLDHLQRTMDQLENYSVREQLWLRNVLQDGKLVHLYQAEARLALGEETLARQHLTELRGTPFEPKATSIWADYLARQGRYAIALQELSFGISRFPGQPFLASQLVDMLVEHHETDQAVTVIRRLAADRPDDLDTRLLAVQFFLRTGDQDKALTAVNRLLDRFPAEPKLYVLKGQILLAAGRFDEALAIAAEIQEMAPNDASISEAVEALKNDNFSKAQEALQLVGQSGRKTGTPFVLAANLALARQQYDDAFDMLSKAAEFTNLRTLSTQWMLSAVNRLASEVGIEAAEEKLDSVLLRFKNDPLLWQAKAELLIRKRNFSAALRVIDQIAELPGGFERAMLMKAQVYLAMDQPLRALQPISAGLQRSPESVALLTLSAQTKLRTDQPAAALSDVRAALNLSPDNVALAVLGAEAMYDLGNKAQARGTLQALKKSWPKVPEIYLRLAKWQLLEANLPAALDELKRGAEQRPDDGGFVRQAILLLAEYVPTAAADFADEIAGGNLTVELAMQLAKVFLSNNSPAAAHHWASRALSLADEQNATEQQRATIHALLGDAALLAAHAGAPNRRQLYEEARDQYVACLKRKKDDALVANALMQLLIVEFEHLELAKRVAEGVRASLPLAELPKAFIDTLYTIYLRAGELQEAEVLMNEALTQRPDDRAWLLNCVTIGYQLGHTEAALEKLRQCELRVGENAAIAYARAKLWELVKNPRFAADAVIKSLKLEPDNVDAHLLAARQLLLLNEPQSAIDHVKKALELNDDLWEAHLLRTQACRAAGKMHLCRSAANESLKKIVALLVQKPQQAELYVIASQIAVTAGDIKTALRILEKGRETNPGEFALVGRSVEVLLLAGETEQARELSTEFARRRPPSEQCLKLGRAFYNGKDLATASKWAKAALFQADENNRFDSILLMGDIEFALGEQTGERKHFEKSGEHYATIVSRYPRHFVAGNNLAWVLVNRLGETERALSLAERLRGDAQPEVLHPSFIGTLARVYRESGQLDQSRRLVEDAVFLHPHNAALRLELGLTHFALDNKTEARRALQTALQIGLDANQQVEARETLAKTWP